MSTDLIPLFLILAAVVALDLWAHKQKKRPHYRASDKPWSINHSHNMPKSPTMQGNGWRIDFPAGENSLNYVQWYKAPALREGQTVTATLRITGGPFVFLEDPSQAPTASMMIQRKRDNLRSPGYRFFSRQVIPMIEGDHTFTQVIGPDDFRDGIGKSDVPFATVLEEMESLGFTFGGPGGRGHGVSGPAGASVELVSLVVG